MITWPAQWTNFHSISKSRHHVGSHADTIGAHTKPVNSGDVEQTFVKWTPHSSNSWPRNGVRKLRQSKPVNLQVLMMGETAKIKEGTEQSPVDQH